MNIYSQDLSSRKAAELAMAYELVTGASGASSTKKVMIAALLKAFEWDLEGCHAQYLASLPTDQKVAVEGYRADGSTYMNNALRTGRMMFKIDPWDLSQTLKNEGGIATLASDVAAYAKSPDAFVKKLYERSGIADVFKGIMKDSVSESIHRWKMLADLKTAVAAAPSRKKDVVLWRGESFSSAFHKPDGLLEKTRHGHGENMKTLSVGSTFVRKDFASFSMTPVIAAQFAGEGCCMYRLTLPKSQPALFMESYTSPREYEVILPPKTKFKVTKCTTMKSRVSTGVEMRVFWLEI